MPIRHSQTHVTQTLIFACSRDTQVWDHLPNPCFHILSSNAFLGFLIRCFVQGWREIKMGRQTLTCFDFCGRLYLFLENWNFFFFWGVFPTLLWTQDLDIIWENIIINFIIMDLLELARFPLNLKGFSCKFFLFFFFGFVVDLCSWIENFGDFFFFNWDWLNIVCWIFFFFS